MAISNLLAANVVKAVEYKSAPGGLVDQVNRQTTLSRILRWIPASSATPSFVALGAGAVANVVLEGANLDFGASNVRRPASLPWTTIASPFGVTVLNSSQAAKMSSPTAENDLWHSELGQHAVELAKKVEAQLFTGNGTSGQMYGLAVAVDDTVAYAGIDPSTSGNEFWKSYVATPGALSYAAIRSDQTAIANASGQSPDIAVCSLSTLNTVQALFDGQRQYSFDVSNKSGAISLQGGGGSVAFDGLNFIGAVDCPADTIYYLNSAFCHVEYLMPSEWIMLMSRIQDLMSLKGLPGTADLGPVPMFARDIPVAALVDQAAVVTQAQLVVTRRNAFGVRKLA